MHSTRYVTSFFFTPPSTTEIYTLSLHDALPISANCDDASASPHVTSVPPKVSLGACSINAVSLPSPENSLDRKSTRLNSSHRCISYAVFCLKKKKKTIKHII